jgi:hypothetical protein
MYNSWLCPYPCYLSRRGTGGKLVVETRIRHQDLNTLLLQDEYKDEHPYGVIPVQANDVFFSIHAVFACAVVIFQTFVYEVRVLSNNT